MSKSNEGKPVIIYDEQGNPEYTLAFTRSTVEFAEKRGFKIRDVADFPVNNIKDLFHFAFRANHKGMNQGDTDRIFDELRVNRQNLLQRLLELYSEPLDSLMDDTSNDAKNFKRAVEL